VRSPGASWRVQACSTSTSGTVLAVTVIRPAEISLISDGSSARYSAGDLGGHRGGVAGRAEDEDALAGPEAGAAAQCDPRRHSRVHRGGNLRRVGVRRQLDGATRAGQGL